MQMIWHVAEVLPSLPLVPLEIPNPAPAMPPGFEPVLKVLAWAKWVALIALVLILIAVAVGMNSDRHGSNYMEKFGKVAIGAIVVSAATSLIGFLSGA